MTISTSVSTTLIISKISDASRDFAKAFTTNMKYSLNNCQVKRSCLNCRKQRSFSFTSRTSFLDLKCICTKLALKTANVKDRSECLGACETGHDFDCAIERLIEKRFVFLRFSMISRNTFSMDKKIAWSEDCESKEKKCL